MPFLDVCATHWGLPAWRAQADASIDNVDHVLGVLRGHLHQLSSADVDPRALGLGAGQELVDDADSTDDGPAFQPMDSLVKQLLALVDVPGHVGSVATHAADVLREHMPVVIRAAPDAAILLRCCGSRPRFCVKSPRPASRQDSSSPPGKTSRRGPPYARARTRPSGRASAASA